MKLLHVVIFIIWVGSITLAQSSFTNSIGMEFNKIPAGTFTMGGDPQSSKTQKNEPAHQVTITKSFYMGIYEVTQEQWTEIMGENPSKFNTTTLGHDASKNPVEGIIWEKAQEFIKKLNEKEGTDKYRLPTEAEWEYACRAGSKGKYCFGNADFRLGRYAWYRKNSDDKTHPVGQKKPNDWGLYDMHGNVWEWCQDWYGEDYYQSSPGSDPTGPEIGTDRVIRGSSWRYTARYCRSSRRDQYEPRDYYEPDAHYRIIGFRLVSTKP